MLLADHTGDQSKLSEFTNDLTHLFARYEFVAILLVEKRVRLVCEVTPQPVNRALLLFGSEYVSHIALLE